MNPIDDLFGEKPKRESVSPPRPRKSNFIEKNKDALIVALTYALNTIKNKSSPTYDMYRDRWTEIKNELKRR